MTFLPPTKARMAYFVTMKICAEDVMHQRNEDSIEGIDLLLLLLLLQLGKSQVLTFTETYVVNV
jgi:hypothetical protein